MSGVCVATGWVGVAATGVGGEGLRVGFGESDVTIAVGVGRTGVGVRA